MDTDKSSMSSWTNVVLPGACVLALALIGYLRWEPPLKTERPSGAGTSNKLPQPPSPPGIVGFYARLWEDPLWTSYQQSAANEANVSTSKNKDQGCLSQLFSCLAPPAKTNANLKQIKQTFRQILCDATRDGGKLLCLPVLVNGGYYADDSEDRMRVHVAVLSALTASRFELTYPTRMSYVDLPIQVCMDDIGQTVAIDDFHVPLKLFQRIDTQEAPNDKSPAHFKHVLVLWIDQDQAQSRPLNVIAQILDHLFRPPGPSCETSCKAQQEPSKQIPNLVVNVLGPADSDGLQSIHDELNCPPCAPPGRCRPKTGEKSSKVLSKCREKQVSALRWLALSLDSVCKEHAIYSPRATIPESYLPPLIKTDPQPVLVRTIGDDACLADALLDELKLRGAFPIEAEDSQAAAKNHECDDAPNCRKTIVLINERDTLYGRVFPKVFSARAKKQKGRVTIQNFSYLRGIDGALPNDRPQTKQAQTKAANNEGATREPPQEEDVRPTGKSQYDYLRRLERQLIELDANEKTDGREGITAIGIVGTDVYDKLLILRALRKNFPNTCFFTTDLEAEFLDPEEIETSRNIVIASHFGLALHPQLQREIPPFRNSYQTAMFFGALRALHEDVIMNILEPVKAADDPWGHTDQQERTPHISPLVFEIGRYRPYQLTIPSEVAGSPTLNCQVHPPSPRESLWLNRGRKTSFAVALVALWICLLIYWTAFRQAVGGDHDDDWKTLFIEVTLWSVGAAVLLILLPMVVIERDHQHPDGEPFTLTEGISIWPPTYLRYLAFLIAIYACYATCQKLSRSSKKLADLWLPEEMAKRALAAPKLWGAIRDFRFSEVMNELWQNCLMFNWPRIRPGWKESNGSDAPQPGCTEVFADYVARGHCSIRFLRVFFVAALYFALSACLFAVTEYPSNPFRGPTAARLSFSILVLAVGAMLVLVFTILDATQLFRKLLSALKHASADWPEEALLNAFHKRQPSPKELENLRELVTIRIIAEHSNVVGKLIIYPFVIVLLMFLARLQVFDYMNLGWLLLAQWGVILGAAVLSAYSMRRQAGQLRDEALARLREVLPSVLRTEYADRLKSLIDEIQQEDGGAFGPWYKDPVLRGLAIPLGGATSMLVIQQVLPAIII